MKTVNSYEDNFGNVHKTYDKACVGDIHHFFHTMAHKTGVAQSGYPIQTWEIYAMLYKHRDELISLLKDM